MLYFRIGYSLDYYDGRSYRIVIDKDNKVKIVDSYSTMCISFDGHDLKKVDYFPFSYNGLSLDLLELQLEEGWKLYFFLDKNIYQMIKKKIMENISDRKNSSRFYNEFRNLLLHSSECNIGVVRLSKSQFEKIKQKLYTMMDSNNC